MESGFYAAATGMLTQTIAMDHITRNITNANVSGYKKEEILFHSFDEDLENEVNSLGSGAFSELASGIDIVQGVTDFSQGRLKNTLQKNHLALEGSGFFEVQGPMGKLYTRNGVLGINADKELVTKEGHLVLSDQGSPIIFDINDTNINRNLGVDDDGTVYLWDDSKVPLEKIKYGKLNLVDFTTPENLERLGYGFWKVNNDRDPGEIISQAKVIQGHQELSNATMVEDMVEMILTQRIYNTNSNFLRTMHEKIQKLIQTFGGGS